MQSPNAGANGRNSLADNPAYAAPRHSDVAANGAEGVDMEDEQLEHEETEQDGLKGLVEDLHTTVVRGAASFFKDTIAPQAASIEEELEQLQHDISSVTNEAHHEKELVEQELARLSNLVLAFQQRIARFL